MGSKQINCERKNLTFFLKFFTLFKTDMWKKGKNLTKGYNPLPRFNLGEGEGHSYFYHFWKKYKDTNFSFYKVKNLILPKLYLNYNAI